MRRKQDVYADVQAEVERRG